MGQNPVFLVGMTIPCRNILLFLMLFLCSCPVYPQNSFIDSVKSTLQTQKDNTNKVRSLYKISIFYAGSYPDSGLLYAQKALDLAEKLHFENGIYYAEVCLANSLATLGNYPLAIEFGLKGLSLAKKTGSHLEIIWANGSLADCYFYLGDFATSLQYDLEIKKIAETYYPDSLAFICRDLSRLFNVMNQPDSALLYAKKSYEGLKSWHYLERAFVIFTTMGDAFSGMHNYDSALFYYKTGMAISLKNNAETDLVDIYTGMAKVFRDKNNPDSALWYAMKVFTAKIGKSYPVGLLKAANMLVSVYESKNKPDSALKYLQITIDIKDSLFNREKTIAVQNLSYKEQEKLKELESSRLQLQARYRMYSFIAALIVFLVIAGILLKNKRQKQLQNMRDSIAEDLHDDIGSTLSSISILSELAKKKSPEASSLLASISESTGNIQENISDIIWTINPKYDRFENILQRMNQFASEILDAKNIELDFVSDPSLSTSRLTMDQRKNFYLFFKEVINNAAKYSEAKKICVRISQTDHHIDMNIRDNGKGFDTTKTFNGNGMNTLQKRGAELNADYKIQSTMNEGTVVQLTFKIT
jgi:signal transduction histidine kinase